jgi:rhodanese-related sulfurtransferase|nr:rhodanese-like domain-containing protein [Kofleriaceae bacterium]
MRALAPIVAATLLACAGCRSADTAAPTAVRAEPAAASVDEVARALAAGSWRAVDANSNLVRRRMGTLPGAVLLSDPFEFTAAELPADPAQPLVFYCSNDACSASHEAAARAIALGHTHVEVMPDGIAGWVSAGKQTQRQL